MAIEHEIRAASGTEVVTLTPIKAIRKKCLDCCCWSFKEVELCTARLCPLWPFRMGKRPGE